MLRSISRCVPLPPKYPAMNDRLRPACCCRFRFHDCTSELLKLGFTIPGESVVGMPLNEPVSAPMEVTALTVTGRANGGVQLSPLTLPGIRWSPLGGHPPPSTV